MRANSGSSPLPNRTPEGTVHPHSQWSIRGHFANFASLLEIGTYRLLILEFSELRPDFLTLEFRPALAPAYITLLSRGC